METHWESTFRRSTSSFLKLAGWGFNVPLFLCNPCGAHGRDTYQFLRSFFNGIPLFDLIAERVDKKKSQQHHGITLQDAFLIMSYLESAGYNVVILEQIEHEWTGVATFNRDGSGDFKTSEMNRFEKFQLVDFIEDVKLRCIIRSLQEVQEKTGDRVRVSFGWAKNFSGVNQLKIIFYDYKKF